MKKSITKKAKPTSRKRPKSVLRKAWETRRAKRREEAKIAEASKGSFLEDAWLTEEAKNNLRSQAHALLAKATPTSETATPRSDNAATVGGPNPDYNPQAEIAEIKRDYRTRQLCGFVGDFQIIRRQRSESDATPIMLSWEQARAVHDYLLMEGYSAYGAASAR